MQNKPQPEPTTPDNQRISAVARHNSRAYALQALYQWHIAGTTMDTIEAEFIKEHIDKKLDMDYFKELIHGVIEHQAEIDNEMKPFLSRSLSEVDPVELSAIRVAIYELLKRPDVPYRVIINEALELTKKFGSVEGHKFVNGLLDRVAKKNRATEIQMYNKQEK